MNDTYKPLPQKLSKMYNTTYGSRGGWLFYMITEELGVRIRELRKKTGLSQEKFALKIDMDRTYFATVESGKRNISVKNIEKIAEGLGVSISDLFEGLGGK